MASALIGYTGFVGSNLREQYVFDDLYNSSNIQDIRGKHYNMVVCAGIQAKKWWANQHPEEDWQGIRQLLDLLQTVHIEELILISTIDVYPIPIHVVETSSIIASEQHAYGRHRYKAEQELQNMFPNTRIIRLPGLFGNYIKKNHIYDLLHKNSLDMINPLTSIPYYSLGNLWKDITCMRTNDIHLLNMAIPPISTQEIITTFFPTTTVGPSNEETAPRYDIHSIHSMSWNKEGNYLYSKEEVLEQLAHFIAHYSRA